LENLVSEKAENLSFVVDFKCGLFVCL